MNTMDDFQIGQKLCFKSHKALMTMALYLSSEGYGVAIIGYHDMYEHILTITALPEEVGD